MKKPWATFVALWASMSFTFGWIWGELSSEVYKTDHRVSIHRVWLQVEVVRPATLGGSVIFNKKALILPRLSFVL